MNKARIEQLAEAYGDDPLEILRNGMLGVARKKKFQKLKDPDQKKIKITQMVTQWEAALSSRKPEVIAWLLGKL